MSCILCWGLFKALVQIPQAKCENWPSLLDINSEVSRLSSMLDDAEIKSWFLSLAIPPTFLSTTGQLYSIIIKIINSLFSEGNSIIQLFFPYNCLMHNTITTSMIMRMSSDVLITLTLSCFANSLFIHFFYHN